MVVSRGTRKKVPRAAERVIRRSVRGSHNCARFGSASSRVSDLRIAALALADMAQLFGELSIYRTRLDQSPPSDALCHRSDASPRVVQLRPSVLSVAASVGHRLDGRERTGSAAGCLLRRGLLSRHSAVHSRAAPVPKLATNIPPGFSHLAIFWINGPCSASKNIASGTFHRALATCFVEPSTPVTVCPRAARSRATGMPAPQPRSRTRPPPTGKPSISRPSHF